MAAIRARRFRVGSRARPFGFGGALALSLALAPAGLDAQALPEGVDPHARYGDGTTALHEAAEAGDAPLVRALIAAEADVAATTRIGAYTPLHLAAAAGRSEAVRALLDGGADPRATTETGEVTPLHFAAAAGDVEAIRALLDAGAEVDARETKWGQTPLVFAVSRERIDAVRALLGAGADPEAATYVVQIPALQAESREAARIRAQVLDSLAALEGVDPVVFRPTPAQVELAVRRANAVEPAERIAPEDVPDSDPDVGDGGGSGYGSLVGAQGGLTPLLHAAREGHAEIVRILLDAGADIDRASLGDRTTPILIAAINGHYDLALELLDRGADPNIASDAGTTPLYAVLNTWWAPKARYPQQQAYLQQEAGYLEAMERLLRGGADPNARTTRHLWYMGYTFDQLDVDTRGSTPFWRAAYATDVPAMELLLAHGADPTLGTLVARDGRARDDGSLDPSGLPPVKAGDTGVLPIHAASGVGYGEGYAGNAHRHVEDGWLPAVRYLVEVVGADVNARDLNGYTPLHHAAARGDNELIRYLVEQGADPMVVSRRGQTTVDMANGPVQRISPFPETIELLESMGAINNHNCRSCQ
jgi:ankyrin repeat protein